MTARSTFLTGRTCPGCGKAELKTRYLCEKYEYQTDRDPVFVETSGVPIEYCEACGESFSGPEAARIRHDALVKALGFLRPEEIRGLREHLGKTPEEFAQLVGSTLDELSMWERGRLIQDRASDSLMRVLSNVPQAVRFLEHNLSGNPDGLNPANNESSEDSTDPQSGSTEPHPVQSKTRSRSIEVD